MRSKLQKFSGLLRLGERLVPASSPHRPYARRLAPQLRMHYWLAHINRPHSFSYTPKIEILDKSLGPDVKPGKHFESIYARWRVLAYSGYRKLAFFVLSL